MQPFLAHVTVLEIGILALVFVLGGLTGFRLAIAKLEGRFAFGVRRDGERDRSQS